MYSIFPATRSVMYIINEEVVWGSLDIVLLNNLVIALLFCQASKWFSHPDVYVPFCSSQ